METKIIDKLEEAFTPEQIPKQMELPKAPKWYYLKYFTKEAQSYRKSVDKYILDFLRYLVLLLKYYYKI
ncbi:MAG: hypothetical protein OHM56_00895 [Spiroplasma phoeniceum]|nr:MAG: hypothetical protein OHM57_00315 [Spiroplasma phoeniceum]UZQ32558.1 MAG: hypothetical protein OHM56_00895 [Spiroplasma phoeniceum]